MKKWVFLLVCFAFLLVGVVGAQDTATATALPALAELDEGWNMLEPGGDTICSNGTDFAFWVRPADTEKLVVYFEGGGACWFGEICDLQSTPTYDPTVTVDDDDPSMADGIFNFENAENPFADYSFVFIPYCTADVHIGNATPTYEVTGEDGETREFTIYHNGYTNATTVLQWVYENFDAPQQIFVSGSSAGSIPSPFYAGLIAEQYPEAQIVALGDASGAYRAPDLLPPVINAWDVASVLPDWEEYEGIDNDNFSFEDFYIATGNRFPNILLAQYNNAHDEVQYFFLSVVGLTGVLLPDQLQGAFDYIMSNLEGDNFTYYTAPGTDHTILWTPAVYEMEVEGVRFVDWLAQLEAGELPAAVECVECGAPPVPGE